MLDDPLATLADDRVALARDVLNRGYGPYDLELHPAQPIFPAALRSSDAALASARAFQTSRLKFGFRRGLAPTPVVPSSEPSPDAPLPRADYLVVTWTIDENNALADVFSPKFGRAKWHRYTRKWNSYASEINRQAPAWFSKRLGSFVLSNVGTKRVLCFKSELHMARDAIANQAKPGTATYPIARLWRQLIDEVQPSYVLTTGTAGATMEKFTLGDVVVTRAARFRLNKLFKNATFRNDVFKSDWPLPPQKWFDEANHMFRNTLGQELQEPPVGPPDRRYPKAPLAKPKRNRLTIHVDGRDFSAFHPILTTDYFEFGTTRNKLGTRGCGVEMGDAMLGMAVSQMRTPPKWAVVRNMSDPVINGDLPTSRINQQTLWAVAFYQRFGQLTSIGSALACWAIVAGT